jgi:hypothetical protein
VPQAWPQKRVSEKSEGKIPESVVRLYNVTALSSLSNGYGCGQHKKKRENDKMEILVQCKALWFAELRGPFLCVRGATRTPKNPMSSILI